MILQTHIGCVNMLNPYHQKNSYLRPGNDGLVFWNICSEHFIGNRKNNPL